MKFAVSLTTLLIILKPLMSRWVALALSITGLDSHFRNSHAGSCLREKLFSEKGRVDAQVTARPW